MGLFSGLKDAKIFQRGKFFREGRFIVMVKNVGTGLTRSSGNKFFAEFKLIACLTPDATLGTGKANTPMKANPGDMATDMTTSNKDSFFSNVREMLLGLTRAKFGPSITEDSIPENEWEGMAEEAVSDAQPFAGLFLDFQATPVTTREGNPFTRKTYGQGLTALQVRQILQTLVSAGDKRHEEKLVFPNGELEAMIQAEAAAVTA